MKYIYDELILRTEYEQGSADSQNICSVLLNQRSVCQGYAKTFQYLCQLAGIPAMLVTGEVNGEGDAWNIVFLDGTGITSIRPGETLPIREKKGKKRPR